MGNSTSSIGPVSSLNVSEPGSLVKPRDWSVKGPRARANFYRKSRIVADAYFLATLTPDTVKKRISFGCITWTLGKAALSCAVERKLHKVVRLLLVEGVDTHVFEYFPSLLFTAVSNRDAATVAMLLEFGVDPNVGFASITPLQYAVMYRRWDITKLLMNYGAVLPQSTIEKAHMSILADQREDADKNPVRTKPSPAAICKKNMTQELREELYYTANYPETIASLEKRAAMR